MRKPWTENEAALVSTPDLTIAERLGRTQRAARDRRPVCPARTDNEPRAYLSREEGLEPISDDEVVRLTRQLEVEGNVVHALYLEHKRGLRAEEAARIAGVHQETVAAWVRAGAVDDRLELTRWVSFQ